MLDRSQTRHTPLFVILITVGVMTGLMVASMPASAAPSVSQTQNIASNSDSTEQSFTFDVQLPPTQITCTLDTSQMRQYGVTLKSATVSGTNKISMNVNSQGDVDITISKGSGSVSATVTLTASTQNVQIPNKPLNHTATCSGTGTPKQAINQILEHAEPTASQQSGFTIKETGIQDTNKTRIQSNDTTITNNTTLTQSINLDLIVPDDGDSDGDTYNVTIDTTDSLAHGINVTGAAVEQDPSGANGLVEVVNSTVTASENVTLTLREAAADRSNGNISRETITVGLDLDATRHAVGQFSADSSIKHIITDEAGNTTATVTYQSTLAQNGSAGGSPFYAVSNLSAPANVTSGNTFTVTATIRNTGNVSGSQTVDYRFNGSTTMSRTVDLTPGSARNVSFTVQTQSRSPGTYTHGVYTANNSATTSIRIINSTTRGPKQGPVSGLPPGVKSFASTSPLTGQQTNPSSLAGKFRVESTYAGNTTVDLRRNSSTNYSLAITIPNGSNVSFYLQKRAVAASQNISNVTAKVDGQPLTFGVTQARGSGWIAFKIDQFSTKNVSFTSTTSSSSLFSSALPGSGGQGPPKDPDGDGTFEDINGDGQTNFDDAVALAFVDDSQLSQSQIDAIDRDGDGDIDFNDAIDLSFDPLVT